MTPSDTGEELPHEFRACHFALRSGRREKQPDGKDAALEQISRLALENSLEVRSLMDSLDSDGMSWSDLIEKVRSRAALVFDPTGVNWEISVSGDLPEAKLPAVAGLSLLWQFQQLPLVPPAPATEGLSEREQTVLQGLARGQTYKEIASAMSISTHTANSHVKNIYQKLHVCSRKAAVRTGQQRGWL